MGRPPKYPDGAMDTDCRFPSSAAQRARFYEVARITGLSFAEISRLLWEQYAQLVLPLEDPPDMPQPVRRKLRRFVKAACETNADIEGEKTRAAYLVRRGVPRSTGVP